MNQILNNCILLVCALNLELNLTTLFFTESHLIRHQLHSLVQNAFVFTTFWLFFKAHNEFKTSKAKTFLNANDCCVMTFATSLAKSDAACLV